MKPVKELIRAKRDGLSLSPNELGALARGIADGTLSDAQVAALAMAIFLRGLDGDELSALTGAMRDSGEVLRWELDAPVLDKHSTGGVGDKVSLVLAPLVAACGGAVPMLSGRALGHTGGTLDKLEAIPGYDTAPDPERLRAAVADAGCAIIGQTADLAPADRRLYAIRDATGSVESIPLVVSSILSKKLAAGLDGLVLDVKHGSGAFFPEPSRARELARALVEVAGANGLRASALLTDMDRVLGTTAGNALEVREAIAVLRGEEADPRLVEVTVALAAQLLDLGGLAGGGVPADAGGLAGGAGRPGGSASGGDEPARSGGPSPDEDDPASNRAIRPATAAGRAAGGPSAAALARVREALADGSAAERFVRMVAALGGPRDILERADAHLPRAPISRAIHPTRAGVVTGHATRQLGLAVLALGGGRAREGDAIDHAVGLARIAQPGDEVAPNGGRPLAVVHARDMAAAEQAIEAVQAAIEVGDAPPQQLPAITEVVA